MDNTIRYPNEMGISQQGWKILSKRDGYRQITGMDYPKPMDISQQGWITLSK
jgi:hypothetical protein